MNILNIIFIYFNIFMYTVVFISNSFLSTEKKYIFIELHILDKDYLIHADESFLSSVNIYLC
jgi:hypothetical protein